MMTRQQRIKVIRYAEMVNERERLPGQHGGPVTHAQMRVLHALVFWFYNHETGHCFPSYDALAEKAQTTRSTVALAIATFERFGILDVHRRLKRITLPQRGIDGRRNSIIKVVRTSNAYTFHPVWIEIDAAEGQPAAYPVKHPQRIVFQPDALNARQTILPFAAPQRPVGILRGLSKSECYAGTNKIPFKKEIAPESTALAAALQRLGNAISSKSA